MEALIEHGANLDAVDGDGFTALHHACNLDRLEAAIVLVKSGASTSIKSKEYSARTAMQLQSKNGRVNLQRIASMLAQEAVEAAFLDQNPQPQQGRKRGSPSL